MKVLVTGLGSIGARHVNVFQKIEEPVEIIAFRRTCTGNELGVCEYADLDRALAENPDVALVTNPTHKHVETAIRCAKAECDLLIEKPLSHTISGVDTLIDIVKEKDLITLMGCQLRFDPILNEIKEYIDSEKLGSVLAYRAESGSYLPDWRPDQDYRESYSADASMGGGVVLDLIHEIDYTYWLLDEIKVTGSEISYADMLDISSEAIAEILFRSDNGTVGSIHMDYCRQKPRRKVEILCEEGSIIGDLKDKTISVEYSDSSEKRSYSYNRNLRFRKQLSHFINCVKEGQGCDNDVEEGKKILELALQAKGHRDA